MARKKTRKKCVVCKRKNSSFWWSSHILLFRTVGYCSLTCRLIANRLWGYLGAFALLGFGWYTLDDGGLILAVGGGVMLLISIMISRKNRYKFPLFNRQSILDNY